MNGLGLNQSDPLTYGQQNQVKVLSVLHQKQQGLEIGRYSWLRLIIDLQPEEEATVGNAGNPPPKPFPELVLETLVEDIKREIRVIYLSLMVPCSLFEIREEGSRERREWHTGLAEHLVVLSGRVILCSHGCPILIVVQFVTIHTLGVQKLLYNSVHSLIWMPLGSLNVFLFGFLASFASCASNAFHLRISRTSS